MTKKIKIALAGNPNVGKTTLFNALTGSRQHVGNWPGKTVEKKEGIAKFDGKKIDIVDLPGIYSLSAYSIEEIVARDYIINEKPDSVIHVVDSSNIERNLYLAMQLIELGANLTIALNMGDVAKRRGIHIDEKIISELLGVPVVKIAANKKEGIGNLLKRAAENVKEEDRTNYGKELEEHIREVEESVKDNLDIGKEIRPRWLAIKLLENDENVRSELATKNNIDIVLNDARRNREHLKDVFGQDIDTIFADARYGFITGLAKESVTRKRITKKSRTEKIDRIATNKYLGIPVFLVLMYIVFELTFTVASPLSDIIDSFFTGNISGYASQILSGFSAPSWISSLVIEGIIGGVGSVLVFVPFIFMLFFIIAMLEDSGYMARAAFVMDRVMHKIGLHGKSFIPMIIGFGCNVPAIMATRTLENKKDRILTILINPFISCGARLPVYVLFAAAFFPGNGDLVVFSLYLIGIGMAILMGFILKKAFFKKESSPFVMELPPYRFPTIKGALIHMWERGFLFVKKAGTLIFAVVVLVWFLASVPLGVEYAGEDSAIGILGNAISPVFAPLGFGNRQSGVALVMGFIAKEVVVGTIGTLNGVDDIESPDGESALISRLQEQYSPLSALSFLIFVLLYTPCMAVVAAIRREIGTKWAIFSVVYTTGVAWVASFLVYNIGLFIGFV